MINRILHLWSIHMKFMKLATGSFHKFHMTTCVRSSIYTMRTNAFVNLTQPLTKKAKLLLLY